MPTVWFVISAVAFSMAILFFVVSAFCFFGLLGQVLPLLGETRNQVQDLGDLAANTVGRAAETMDLVELRVSQAMGQASISGKEAAKQALGVGTVLAGLYMATRLVGAVRGMWRSHVKEHSSHHGRHRGWKWGKR